jgi:hypothetical protein
MINMNLPNQYSEFKQVVDEIRTGSVQVRYLGGGAESEVYEAILDDKKYAVKFANKYTRLDRPRNTERATQRKIDAGLRGLGVQGLEQIKAASTEEGVAIFELIEGTTVQSMDDTAIANVSSREFQMFCETINQAVELGIEFDPWNQDGSNVVYTPNVGFTAIDYFVNYAKTSPDDNRVNGLLALGSAAMKFIDRFGNDYL